MESCSLFKSLVLKFLNWNTAVALQDRVDRETVPVLVHDLVLDMKREGHRMEADKLREAYGLEDG